jgi:preprotein translocase subunit SecF
MESHQKAGITHQIRQFYEKHNQKLLIIPIIVILASLGIIFNFYQEHGDIMEKDVTLKGGITATVTTEKSMDLNQVEATLSSQFGDATARQIAEFGSNKQVGIIVEVATEEETALKQALSEALNLELTNKNYSVEIMGSSLGSSFYKQMLSAMVLAFIFMAIVIFILYRSLIPSLNVVSAALWDIIVALALADLIGMRISTTGISAFLLLIGYSIDTDVLMTTRVLKRKEGTMMDRLVSSINTGLTMTLTAIVAVVTGLVLSTSPVIKEMFTIILFGLITDIIMTYCMNAPILIRYAKKKGVQ